MFNADLVPSRAAHAHFIEDLLVLPSPILLCGAHVAYPLLDWSYTCSYGLACLFLSQVCIPMHLRVPQSLVLPLHFRHSPTFYSLKHPRDRHALLKQKSQSCKEDMPECSHSIFKTCSTYCQPRGLGISWLRQLCDRSGKRQ